MIGLAPRSLRLAGLAAAWLLLWLPPLRPVLESDMALHMAVQLPLLAILGALLAPLVRAGEPSWLAEADWLGIPGLMLAFLASSFWMLPRALDGALADPRMEAAKFVSVPLLIGLVAAASWRRMPSLGRAFIIANFISKLGILGGLYLAAPVRLCAYYRLDQQVAAGWLLLGLAAAASLLWFIAAFVGRPVPAPRPGAAEARRIGFPALPARPG
jgi:hypothetical protein